MKRAIEEDTPLPDRTTPQRLARQLDRLAQELSAIAIRLHGLGALIDDQGQRGAIERALACQIPALAELATAVRYGRCRVLDDVLDREAGRGTRPLLDRIEDNSGNNETAAGGESLGGAYAPTDPEYYHLGGKPPAAERIEAEPRGDDEERIVGAYRLPKSRASRAKKLYGLISEKQSLLLKAIADYEEMAAAWPDGRTDKERSDDERDDPEHQSPNGYHFWLADRVNQIGAWKRTIQVMRRLLEQCVDSQSEPAAALPLTEPEAPAPRCTGLRAARMVPKSPEPVLSELGLADALPSAEPGIEGRAAELAAQHVNDELAAMLEPSALEPQPTESICCTGCGLDLLSPEAAEAFRRPS